MNGDPLAPLKTLVVVATLTAGCGPESGRAPEHSDSGRPRDWFADVTARTGVAFVHRAGTNYFMPDQVGSGVVVFDFNRDERLDLYLVQNGGGAANQLFEQRPEGTFQDVSAGSGLEVVGRGMGAIAGDVNNDGWPDVVVTEYGATRLFRNLGTGKFQEITRESGIDNPRWAAPASFIDFDRDGWLDLVVGNYVDYDPTQVCTDVQGRQDFCAPGAFRATATRIWRNRTGKAGAVPRFEECTEASGLARVPGVALGLVCADFDGDHWPDIFCSDDGRPNRLFMNHRDGSFSEEGIARGVALNAMGRTAANMGVAFGDMDGDGLPDLFVTHLAEEFHSLFRQDRPGLFSDSVAQAGLQDGEWRGTGFGTVTADLDRDGKVDLVFVNGLVRRAVPGQRPVLPGVSEWWGRYAQRPQVYSSDGTGRFRDRSAECAELCGLSAVGRSLALGDLDRDGAPDLVVGNAGGPLRILRGTPPGTGYWLSLRLVDPSKGGRDMIGAEVRFRSGNRLGWGLIQPATSYLSSHEPAIHLTFEDAGIQSLTVRWPDGGMEEFSIPGLNRRVTLSKGEGKKAVE